MSHEQKALANHVVKTFQALLDNGVKDSIGEHNFEALNSLVREAITDHTETSLDRLEGMIKQMRAELDKRAMEL